jgi:hypothetical protein
MDPYADIDLDSESAWLDGAWHTRQALADRIKQLIEAGDFRVSRLGQALERLEAAVGQGHVLSVRLPPDLTVALETASARLGRSVGQIVREALATALAADFPAAPAAVGGPPIAVPAPPSSRPAAPPARPPPPVAGAVAAPHVISRPPGPPPPAPPAKPAARYPDEALDDDPLARDFFNKS